MYSQNRVVGGTDANIQDHPYMARLVSANYYTEEAQFCGETILSEYWILTAAHFFINEAETGYITKSELEVFAGITDLTEDHNNYYEVDEIFLYSDEHDIALIKLKEPLPLSNKVKAISWVSEADANNGLTSVGT